MPLATYTLFTLAGSAIWAFALAGVGYGVGASYQHFDHEFKYAEYAIVAGIVLFAAYYVYRRIAKAKVGTHGDSAR